MPDPLLAGLKEMLPAMTLLTYSPEARSFYDVLSGSLIWTDEIPDSSLRPSGLVECLRPIFRFRTSLILGAPEEQYVQYWNEAVKLFPSWPGFRSERRSETHRNIYETFRNQVMKKIDDLFDDA